MDVGYTDRKKYKRKEGVEVEVEKNQIGREKVMNAVVEREKRRKVSEYTGSGIVRKERVGTGYRVRREEKEKEGKTEREKEKKEEKKKKEKKENKKKRGKET